MGVPAPLTYLIPKNIPKIPAAVRHLTVLLLVGVEMGRKRIRSVFQQRIKKRHHTKKLRMEGYERIRSTDRHSG